MRYFLRLVVIIILLTSCKSKVKYTGCWIEKDELGEQGHCRHNGILTDSGYLFTDTICNHQSNKLMVHTTLITIAKNKNQ